MDAKTLFSLVKPHLQAMEPREKLSFTELVGGSSSGSTWPGRRKILSLDAAKSKLERFRRREMIKERS